ncbi:MAG: hypothetical protein KJ630_22795 [Proteobacteria bacterium]|nr:hypothetical protein [Pseudomonadota bacterium]
MMAVRQKQKVHFNAQGQGKFTSGPECGAEWKVWFADSKVVDSHKNPLVVYHGTCNGGFDTFRTDSGYSVEGATFFSANPEIANGFADSWEDGDVPAVYPVYLSIQNPKVLRSEDVMVKTTGGMLVHSYARMSSAIALCKAEGHDGAVFEEVPEMGGAIGLNFAVFESTQIKSIFDTGHFIRG